MAKLQIDPYIEAIDNKNIDKIKLLKENNIGKDIVFEIHNNGLLTAERLQYIVQNKCEYLTITLTLIKKLLKEDNFELLDIIFSQAKLYDNEFIKILLFHRKNNIPLSTLELGHLIENYNLSSKKDKDILNDCYHSSHVYLVNACLSGKIDLVRCFDNIGMDINKIYRSGKSPVFYAFSSGNENLIKYLIKRGVYVNVYKQRTDSGHEGETLLFNACSSGNENLVKYLIELGADVNKENRKGEIPLFNACSSGNENLVKYLVEYGADINKENSYSGITPLFNAIENGNEVLV